MATDTGKKSASTEENTTSTVKTGEDSKKAGPRRLQIPASSRKRYGLFIVVAAVFACAAGLIATQTHLGQKVYAKVGSHKIYKQDIQDLIGKNKGISDHDAAEVLADKYLYEEMANKDGIKVTDKDIQNAYGSSIGQQKSQNKYAYQSRVNELYYEKLQTYIQGVYKGYVLVTHFSRNIQLQQPTAQSFHTTVGDPAAIAADKKYAQDFITNLYDQINAHKITWDQAAQMEQADPQVGTIMYPSLTHSGPFDTSKVTNSLLVPASALEQIQKLKAGQTSKPFTVTVVNTVGDSNDSFESYFLVVRMDYKYGGGGSANLLQEIDQTKQKLGYKIYV